MRKYLNIYLNEYNFNLIMFLQNWNYQMYNGHNSFATDSILMLFDNV